MRQPVSLLPRRRRTALALIAAALAATAFGAGWFAGDRSDDVQFETVIPMAGTAQAARRHGVDRAAAPGRGGQLADERRSSAGSRRAATGTDYYELWLTKDGKLADPCGRFTVHAGLTKVVLSVPYGLRRYDGWVVTKHGSYEPLIATAKT